MFKLRQSHSELFGKGRAGTSRGRGPSQNCGYGRIFEGISVYITLESARKQIVL